MRPHVLCRMNSKASPFQAFTCAWDNAGWTRRRLSALFLTGLFSMIFAQSIGAQGNDIVFDAITYQENGLPYGQVQAILQDRHGFMWFGTQSGLVKYDGQALTVYTYNPDDPHSLSDNNVLALCEGRDGNLWIGTNVGGLNRFDRASGAFKRFQNDPAKPTSIGDGAVRSICEDRTGTLWIGLGRAGLARFDGQSETFNHFWPNPSKPSAEVNQLNSVFEDRSGNLWLSTAGGLARFERDTSHFSVFTPEQQTPEAITKIFEDHTGSLWLASRRGLLQFDRSTARFKRFTHNGLKPESISSDFVRAIAEDQAGRLWVGTEDGLNRFEPQSDRFVHYTNDANDVASLLDNWVVTLYRDRAGSLWVGMAKGINRINRGIERFNRYRVQRNGIPGLSDGEVSQGYEDSAGIIWISTGGGGLNKLNRQTGRIEFFRHDPRNPRSLSSNSVVTVYEDRTHAFWVGTRGGGLDLLDRRTGSFTHYRFDPENPYSISNNAVISIYEDSAGTLWVGTLQGGLNKFDRQRGQFTRFLRDPANPHSLGHNLVTDILEGRDGRFWVATEGGGLNLLDRQTGQFTSFKHNAADAASISSNAVYSLAEDASGTLWIATLGGGLNRLDRATGSFTHYTEKDGLASNNVVGVLVDVTGAIWMNTVKGVSRFDPRTGSFRRYTVRDGLASETPTQKGQSQTRAGEVILGGAEGMTIFDPRQFSTEPMLPPPIALTAFKKFDQPINFGHELTEVRQIELAQRENFFSFEFAALDYKDPNRNQYAYRLEGFDPNWIYCGTRRYASYTNLNAGTYLFRVKAANSDGVWNEQDVAVKIIIIPPFYRTWWFRLVALLMLAGVIGLIFKQRLDQANRARRAQEAFSRRLIDSQEQERTRMAAELHDSLGQNLLVIKNYALMGLNTVNDQNPTREHFTEISDAATLSLEEVRQIAHNLRPYQLERLGLTNTLQAMLRQIANASDIGFAYEVDQINGLLTKDEEISFYRIVQEAINNILKHSGANDARIYIKHVGDEIQMTIADDGCGFTLHPAAQAELQKRGFGLAGIAERVRMLGGNQTIHTAPGKGTTIHVTIQTNKHASKK